MMIEVMKKNNQVINDHDDCDKILPGWNKITMLTNVAMIAIREEEIRIRTPYSSKCDLPILKVCLKHLVDDGKCSKGSNRPVNNQKR